MDRILQIELYKVKREIKRYGKTYKVQEILRDEYGEQIGEKEKGNIIGLFHITKGYIKKNITDATETVVKAQPKMVVTEEQIKNIIVGNIITINCEKYVVNNINNIQEYNIIYDLSLERIVGDV